MISFSLAREDGLKWRELKKDNLLRQAGILQEQRTLQSMFIYPEEEFDEEEALKIVKRINTLPDSLKVKIVERGIKVKLFSGSLTDNQSAAHLKGQTPRGYVNPKTTWDDVPGMGGAHTVLVKIGASDRGSGHSSVNLELHEIAHSIDKIVYDGIREDLTYLRIWGKEVDALFPGQAYYSTYPEEYFAEAFAMYYIDAEQNHLLKREAPDTYQFIKQLN
ncbi:anthrax toxin lethal factor-related metalloendopeptidase [Peribacillus sp. NPDC097675]|uniref:anthrax toxin lethal factor-related metalloendopeptidase n=1 Tax=Peribacillus sp. NPDC097675 TaxID=3390618 RepID=UPI003D01C730